MSRKDYKAFAAALKFHKPSMPVCPPADHACALKYQTNLWEDLVVEIADLFAADNGRFDRGRFYAAAGLEDKD